MNERQEQTADVLGKLTVLGTIVLPMNIITGMWGMNVPVPGQDSDNSMWFWSSKYSQSLATTLLSDWKVFPFPLLTLFTVTAGLLVFGVSCFFIAKRVYGIV